MRKYHIADILTALEVVCSLIMFGMIFLRTPVDIALWVFAIGELCDAFDGICARRWHYPDDGKRRWWRVHAPLIDQLSDITLAIASGLYFLVNVYPIVGACFCFGYSIICLVIQFIVKLCPISKKVQLRLILGRRYLYVSGIAAFIIMMIIATSWALWLKQVLLITGAVSGLFLVIVKRDRLTEDKTPLDRDHRQK